MKYVFTVLFLSLFFLAQSQSIVYVTPTGAGNQSGSSWTNALPGNQLQSRLASASTGTQFWVSAGTYLPSSGSSREVSFFIPSGVQVYGGFSGHELNLSERNLTLPSSTTLSGNIGNPTTSDDNSYHIVQFKNASTNTRLDGFVITGSYGYSSYPNSGLGGGIYNDGSETSEQSSPLITNCLITNNYAFTSGGGIFNNGYRGNCNPTFLNCIIAYNSIYNENGGGVYNNGYQGTCNPTFINCLIVNNSVPIGRGGGMYNEAYQGTCRPILTNCTLAYNTSYNYGGAMFNTGVQGTCTPVLKNDIIWANTSSLNQPGIYNNAAAPEVTFSDIQNGYSGTGNINADPLFNGSSDLRPQVGSPVIDAGDPSSNTNNVSYTDLVGNARIQRNRIDMGAYEYQQVYGKFYVTVSGAGNQSGSSWSNALGAGQLKKYLAMASEGSVFWLAGGLYTPGLVVTETFRIPTGVQVYGGFAGTEANLSDRILTSPSSTTLSGEEGDSNFSGDNNRHVVTFQNVSSDTRLDGVVITGGYATSNSSPDNAGGGIYISSSSNSLSNPTIANCTIIGNSAVNGGGIYTSWENQGSVSIIIQNCVFESNYASSEGAGMHVYGSTGVGNFTITQCTFRNNQATKNGGGLSFGRSFGTSDLSITQTSFENNTAANGAGIYFSGSFNGGLEPKLTNCVFKNNQATATGGAISLTSFYYTTISPTLINCTLVGNIASQSGNTFYAVLYPDAFSTYTIRNSILSNYGSAYATDGGKISPTYNITYSNIQGGYSGTGNIDADPLFVDAANGNYRLLRNSPSINTGDPNSTTATVSATDLAGGARIVGGRIDMGAYEFAPMADLRLAFATSSRTVMPNQPVTYNLTVTNDGPEPTSNVTWQNRLPANLLFAGGQGVTAADGIVNGSVGSLAPGASTTFSYQLQPTQAGQFVNAAQITASDITDPDSQPNSGTGDGQDDATTVDIRVGDATGSVFSSPNPNQIPLPAVQSNQPVPDPTKIDLSLSLSATNRTPKVGDALVYTLTILNQGGTTATGVQVTAYLPAGQQFELSPTMSPSDGGITGSVNSIAPGSSATLQFTARMTASGTGITKAQIRQASPTDVDSSPDNGTDNGEDDTATIDIRTSSN